MTEVSANLRNIFFPKIPPILKLEVGFFSGKKKFFRDFPNLSTFIYSKLHFCKFEKKSENLFGSGGRSLPPASPAVGRGGAS